MQTSETLNSPPAPTVAGDATENRPTTPSAVPLAKPSSAEVLITEVLITEQQVMFGTAAAVVSRPGNRLMAALSWVFATSTTETRPRRQNSVPRRPYYLESARMGREMHRL
ncbi:MAG TPA: hypothetical protein VN306_13185 [Mycobacterium sp.]|nr:hypothetical protein [Mycobacterium sp.]